MGDGNHLCSVEFVFPNDLDGNEFSGFSTSCLKHRRKCAAIRLAAYGHRLLLSHFLNEFETFQTRVSRKSTLCLSFLCDYSGSSLVVFNMTFPISVPMMTLLLRLIVWVILSRWGDRCCIIYLGSRGVRHIDYSIALVLRRTIPSLLSMSYKIFQVLYIVRGSTSHSQYLDHDAINLMPRGS